MTTDEIKALIAQTIEGQGDAVDVGGGLAKILNGIVDMFLPLIIKVGEGTNYPLDTILSEERVAEIYGKILLYDTQLYFPSIISPDIANSFSLQGFSSLWVNSAIYNEPDRRLENAEVLELTGEDYESFKLVSYSM